jgi:putative PIN family toxin of toxin-antitoxin system
MRAVLDVNVHVSALLSGTGAPASILRAWRASRFELIVSRLLLEELARALAYPQVRMRVPADDAAAYVALLERTATTGEDAPVPAQFRSADPGDDYLVALAAAQRALLVSGDAHVLALEERLLPVYTPRAFLELLDRQRT